jgi:replication factor C subunit 2/4
MKHATLPGRAHVPLALLCFPLVPPLNPPQSRCAILRYSRLSDEQVLSRLVQVCSREAAAYTAAGLEAVVFTAEGDLRMALNNLQSTVAGFGLVNDSNVFKV